ARHSAGAEYGYLIILDVFVEGFGVYTRNRQVTAQAVHRQQRQREQYALPKIRDPKDVSYGFEEFHGYFSSLLLGFACLGLLVFSAFSVALFLGFLSSLLAAGAASGTSA